jgi:ABC-2 type transport system ATP-binding protein
MATPAIQVKNLKKHFGKTKAVDGVTFDVAKGEIFSFLGPNGAGKTTTIRCMMDFIRPSEGSVTILGRDAQKDSLELKKIIGYLSGEVRLNDKWTGNDHINFFKKIVGKQNSADTLVEKLQFNPKTKTRALSSGNRQKLGVILALMANPSVIILDEPTTGLDPLLQHTVYELLTDARKNGATIFMSSHNLADVERMSDRVGIIRAGKMVGIESIVSLRKKRLYSVHITFKEKVNKEDLHGNGIEVIGDALHGFDLKVSSDLDILVKRIAKFSVQDIEVEHAGLEEIFMKYYQK